MSDLDQVRQQINRAAEELARSKDSVQAVETALYAQLQKLSDAISQAASADLFNYDLDKYALVTDAAAARFRTAGDRLVEAATHLTKGLTVLHHGMHNVGSTTIEQETDNEK